MGYLPKTMYLREEEYASEYRKSLQGVTKIVRVPQWESLEDESPDMTVESPIHAITFKGNVMVTSGMGFAPNSATLARAGMFCASSTPGFLSDRGVL